MSTHIGSVILPYPLAWVNKDDRVVLGSSARTRNANMVTLSVENPSQKYRRAKLLFDWIPLDKVNDLKDLWRAGGTYSADFEGLGTSHTVRFDPENGIKDWKHPTYGERAVHGYIEGKGTDFYQGELNLIIESAT